MSILFVGTPLARSIVVQAMLTDARQGTFSKRAKAVSALRAVATPQDLRPSRNPISGFALASLLIPNRGLDSGSDIDKDAYFKITGRPYFSNPSESANEMEQSPNVGAKVPGLALSKSQITGSIDATTLSSSIDWALTLHNSTTNITEGRGEIQLPKQAVVSRVTLWINGEPREAAFSSTSMTSQAYESVVARSRDPLLVTMPAPDRVLFQCFPVQPNSKMKIRLGFKVPLQTADGKTCSIRLPKFLSTNFTQPRRHRINLFTQDMPIQNLPGMVAEKHPNGYSLRGIMRSEEDSKNMSLVLKRTLPLREMATPDWYSHGKRYIVQQLQEVTTSSPARLFVVVDLSQSLKNKSTELKKLLEEIPSNVKPVVYLAKEPTEDELTEQEQSEKKRTETEQAEEDQTDTEQADASLERTLKTEAAAKPVKEVLASMEPDAFIGGQDNHPLVREALEAAAEAPNCAVLWIHGPQPLSQNVYDFTPLDLVHGVRLFDLQIGKGPNSVLSALEREDTAKLILRKTLVHKSIASDLELLWSDWSEGSKRLAVRRTITTIRPQMTIVTDSLASAEVTSLWAQDEVARLQSMEQEGKAIELASRYRLVTPVSGAVVLETPKEYEAFKLNPGKWRAGAAESGSPLNQYVASSGGGGLVGAPVDPRYGQSNEVGQLADFGYDTARDMSRMGTALSTLIALIIAAGVLRSGGAITSSRLIRAVVLVVAVPTVVHFVGTFAINNYGGLGGGL